MELLKNPLRRSWWTGSERPFRRKPIDAGREADHREEENVKELLENEMPLDVTTRQGAFPYLFCFTTTTKGVYMREKS
jgi:hypothetical protein